jgi:cell division protease FtsH
MANHAPKRPQGPEPPRGAGLLLPWLAMLAVIAALALVPGGPRPETITWSAAKRLVQEGGVESAVHAEHAVTLRLPAEGEAPAPERRAVVPEGGAPELLALLDEAGVEVSAEAPRETSVLALFLPWLLILGVFWYLQRRTMRDLGGLGGGLDGRGLGGLFSGRYSKPVEKTPAVSFDDVAGQDQAKQEVAELVTFLREPERFARVGAEVPHGVLLVGPPGTGKTLLARALAGEAGVPFFSTSGSEFVEVFVGVGAGRVRRMFEAARAAVPAVIFIDELDSIGRRRGTGLGGGHDEREQTLNQILAELDGFGAREAVVVLAATNRPDVLDPALLRPGRFDRHVALNLPDRPARRAILGIHARDMPLADERDLDDIAAGTPGFSGADLKNLLNEAAIQTARRSGQIVSREDLAEARDKVMMGTVRTLAIQPGEKHRLAVHEAGHALVAHFTPGADPLYKVTIIPRGRSLGGTHMLSREEHHTLPEDYVRGQLAILLAGRAAEKLLLGSVSSGAEDDIRRATKLARAMVASWGMSETLGPMDLSTSEEHPFLGQAIAQPRDHADATAAAVDAAVARLLQSAAAGAAEVLTRERAALDALIEALEREETLDAERIAACLEGRATQAPPRPAGLTRPPHVARLTGG